MAERRVGPPGQDAEQVLGFLPQLHIGNPTKEERQSWRDGGSPRRCHETLRHGRVSVTGRWGNLPKEAHRLATEVAGTWGTTSPYEDLARLLLELHKSDRSPREVAAEVGRELILPESANGSLEHLEAEMARRGFEPRRLDHGAEPELVFGLCPYEALAGTDPDVVCELHLGLSEGIAEAAGADVEVTQLVAHDPEQAGCRLGIRSAGAAPGPTD